MRRKLGILVGLLALVLGGASTAIADAPTVTLTPWDRTRVIPASAETCPFDVAVHSQGTFREAVYSTGRDVTTVEDFHLTWSNPVSGKSLASPLAAPSIGEPNGAGT